MFKKLLDICIIVLFVGLVYIAIFSCPTTTTGYNTKTQESCINAEDLHIDDNPFRMMGIFSIWRML